jgi:putative hydrolase of the HAD superfamily
MSYSAVVFDAFGTLIETATVSYHDQILMDMASALGAPFDGFRRLWNGETSLPRMTGEFSTLEANLVNICERLALPVDATNISIATQIRLDAQWNRLLPVRGAVETVVRLKETGHRIGLISDCSAEVPSRWNGTSLAALMDAAVFSCVEGIKKPDPRIYRRACERLGVDPKNCMYVGDGSSKELTGAMAVGMHPVLVLSNAGVGDVYEERRADVVEWTGDVVSRISDILMKVED